MAFQRPVADSKTIPLKILVDKQRNKVVFVETTKDFVDTLFSFLSLPLATIVGLLETNNNDQQQSESTPFLDNIRNLYQSVQNLDSDDVWNNSLCKQILLRPKNPCESLCLKLFMNIDDTVVLTPKLFVCDSCCKFTTFSNIDCTCGKSPNKEPRNLDIQNQNSAEDGVIVREKGSMFLISDDLKIVSSSMLSSLLMLINVGYSDLTQLEEITHNIAKHEIINLLKYTLISNEPLTNTILASNSKNKDNKPNHFASAVRATPFASDITSKIDVKVMQSKTRKDIICAEADGDFVDFIFSFLTMPLGSIVKRLGVNSFSGCVGNLYESVKSFDPTSVLLNPGLVRQFSCPNHPLNFPNVLPPPTTYYYGQNQKRAHYYETKGVISKSHESILNAKSLISLDPWPLNMSKEGVVGFVKRDALYGVGDDLKVKKVSANFCFSYLKELNLSLDDLEVKLISIGEVEALSLLGACVTSNFTLTSGLKDFLNPVNNPVG
ncbi:unnamed protein product [Vicia faba]|uniref:DUF674 family protein n=1 Tax=Vicia faba TaxID=3906 RepID=A0AAV0ZSZ8_VICFA|nr:unnamed protein product [Vicia faba]CAI8601005.1 unnamed protein product [Vicia faba]CAI8601006.1 unnamed protein product [Vicia faba]